MTRFQTRIRIEATAERAWGTLADLTEVQNYSDSVSGTCLNTDARQGVGASRHCDLVPLGQVDETVLEWEEGRRFVHDLVPSGGAPPLRGGRIEWVVEPDGDETVATITIAYDGLAIPVVGGLLDALFVRPRFRTIMRRMALGLKHYVETGEPVDRRVVDRLLRSRKAQSALSS